VAVARQRPGFYAYASPGTARPPPHRGRAAGKAGRAIDIIHVPYKGGAPALADTIAGQVPFLILTGAGACRRCARKTAGARGDHAQRTPAAPEIPTVAEELNLPGYEVDTWLACSPRPGRPEPIIARMQREAAGCCTCRREQNLLRAEHGPGRQQPEELERVVRAELKRWAEVIRSARSKATSAHFRAVFDR